MQEIKLDTIKSQVANAENAQLNGDLKKAISIYQELINSQENNSFFYNKLGQVKAKSKDWQGAIDNYQKALELGIANPFWTCKNLGDALKELQLFEQAIVSYQKALDIKSDNPEVYDSLGQVQSLQDDFINAIASYQKALELGIKNRFWTYKNLGDCLLKEKRLDEAISAYQEALKLEPENSLIATKLKEIKQQEKENPDSSKWLEIHDQGDECFIKEKWEDAIAFYDQAIKLNPNYFWSFYNSGRALAKLEKWNKAILFYKNAIKIDPEQLNYVNPQLQEAEDFRNALLHLKTEQEIAQCLQKADSYFQQKQWDRAISLYQKVINIKPEIGKSVYKSLGISLIAKKNSSSKLQRNADSKDDTYSEEYYKIADEYFKQGKLDEAEIYHRKVIKANPNFAVSYRALGDIYKQKNDFSQAVEYYAKSVELKPNYCHAYQRLAFVLHQQGNIKDAIAAYRSYLKIKPSDSQIKKKLAELIQEIDGISDGDAAIVSSPDEYYKIGEAYYQQGQLDAALEAHQKAISLNPNLTLSYRALGDIYARTQRPVKAIDSYRQAVELKKDYYYGYQKLGNALQNQGESQQAISAYRRALEIKPSQSDVQEKLKTLLKKENMLPVFKQYNPQDYPRVLVVSPIKFNQQAGGGVTMGNLFRGWPQNAIAQIHSDMFTEADYSVCSQYFYLPSNQKPKPSEIPLKEQLLIWCKTFKPDIIFARPIDHPNFYWWLPQELSKELDIPIATNIMDDWPARYEAREDLEDGGASKLLLQENLQEMFDNAVINIGISPEMCRAYQQRYSNEFVPFHNCIDVLEWSTITKSYEITGEFTLLYLGVVTQDKELWSLKDVRDTVLELRDQGYAINMQIYSAPFCKSIIEEYLEHKPGIEYAGYVHPSKLPRILSEADLLVLPINFDEASLKYVGYSIQTKVPEYMASGTPILAYGSPVSPNISYANRDNWGLVVDKPDKELLKQAIVSVIKDSELRSRLGKYARNLAFRNHDAKVIRENYRQLMVNAAFGRN